MIDDKNLEFEIAIQNMVCPWNDAPDKDWFCRRAGDNCIACCKDWVSKKAEDIRSCNVEG